MPRRLVTSLISDVLAGNGQRADEALAALALPDAKEYFKLHFDDGVADRLTKTYDEAAEHLPELSDVLKTELDKGRTKAVVEAFDDPDDRKAVGFQSIALREMRNPTPVYSVRLVGKDDETGSFHIWSFVHDGKAFRWVGKMANVRTDINDKEKKILELRIERAHQLAD